MPSKAMAWMSWIRKRKTTAPMAPHTPTAMATSTMKR